MWSNPLVLTAVLVPKLNTDDVGSVSCMNVDELAECALNPKTRILRQMKMTDVAAAKKAAKMFDTLMGSDVGKRRDYLVANSNLLDQSVLDF